MDLRLLSAKGLPKDSLLSIRVGSSRQQAPASSQRPYKFPALTGKEQMKVDVYVPIGHTRLLVEPGDSRFSVPLIPASAEAAACSDGVCDNMSLEFEVTGNGSTAATTAPESFTVTENGMQEDFSSGVSERGWSRPSSATSTTSFQKGARHRAVLADAQPYFEQHGVMNMMQALLQAVIKEKPADPAQYMIQVLQNSCKAAAGRGGPHIGKENGSLQPASQPKRMSRPHSAGCLRTRASDGGSQQLSRPQSAIPKIVKFSAPTIEEYTAFIPSDGSVVERGTTGSRRAIPCTRPMAAPVVSSTGLHKDSEPPPSVPGPAPANSTVLTSATTSQCGGARPSSPEETPASVLAVSHDLPSAVSSNVAPALDGADADPLNAAGVEQGRETVSVPSSSMANLRQVVSSCDSYEEKEVSAHGAHVARVRIKVRRGPQPSQCAPQSPQAPVEEAAPDVLQEKFLEDPGLARGALGQASTEGRLPQTAPAV